MSVRLLSLLVFSGLSILTACGGGGSGSNTPPVSNNPVIPANPANPTVPVLPVVPVVPAPPVAQIPLGISMFAGSASGPGNLDGVGDAAYFGSLRGAGGNLKFGGGAVKVGPNGDLFVADASNATVRRVTPAGVVTTIAGSPGQTGKDDGIGQLARFVLPSALAVATDGVVYVVDDGSLRRISADGQVSTIPAPPELQTVARGLAGSVYAATPTALYIYKPGSTVQLLAGVEGAFGSQDGVGSQARFSIGFLSPGRMATDSSGNVYLGENGRVRKITPEGVSTLYAGSRTEFGNKDGAALAATFQFISGVAVDSKDNIWVTESANRINTQRTLRKISASGAVTTAYARLDAPFDMFDFDKEDRLLFAAEHGIFNLESTGSVKSVAGSTPVANEFSDALFMVGDNQEGVIIARRIDRSNEGSVLKLNRINAQGNAAKINSLDSLEFPVDQEAGGIGIDSAGTLYSASASTANTGLTVGVTATGGAIYQANTNGQVSTLLNWPAGSAAAMSPAAMTVTRNGSIYFIDRITGNLVKWTKQSGLNVITNIPGARQTQFFYPFTSIAVSDVGIVYVFGYSFFG